jgi:copper resistance protein B
MNRQNSTVQAATALVFGLLLPPGAAAQSMGPMQGGKPPPDARNPNAYAEGTHDAGLGGMDMADDASFGRLLINSLEWAHSDDEHGQNVDAEAWYGGDYNKAWLKAEGDRRDGRLESMRTEALWDRAFAPFWGTQLGVRHDTGGGSRNWLAFGVQGLAPYWFETEATGYWGNGGTFAARVDVKYELLFTQRLALQPEFAANLYSREDRKFGNGAGLSDLRFDLRLRYEVRRQFAPYIGVSWHRKVGGTARLAEQQGKERQTVEALAGVRLWF